jgi:pilus assembly protein TadC
MPQKPPARKRNPHLLRATLDRAGVRLHWMEASKRLFQGGALITLLASLTLLFLAFRSTTVVPFAYVVVMFLAMWTLGFALALALTWAAFYVYLDLRIVQRRIDVEEVLPLFLQLTAANIRAGMAPDAALWHAVRPRFGILAKEIETVAKDTLAGESLPGALRKLSDRYDSQLLRRTINLLIEGMEAGAELADVLNKVSSNIQESRILQREMSANIATYTIFIGSASVLAAPVLLALATQLLVVLNKLVGGIGTNVAKGAASQVASMGLFVIGGSTVDPAHFRIFAVAMLVITSLFSSMMISAMKRGTIIDGVKSTPLFIGISLVLYWLGGLALGTLLGGFFAKV